MGEIHILQTECGPSQKIKEAWKHKVASFYRLGDFIMSGMSGMVCYCCGLSLVAQLVKNPPAMQDI